MEKIDARKEAFELVELFDKPALFTNGRISRFTVPQGWFCYDLRGGDNDPGDPVTVEKFVAVNHAGAILVPEKLTFKNGMNYIGFAEKDHIIAINRANLKECDNSAKIVSKSLVL